jgi:mono/diheme cytochrome c family protein
MSMREHLLVKPALVVAALAVCSAASGQASNPAGGASAYEIGRAPTAEEMRVWDIDIGPGGSGLPEGAGSVEQGKALFTQKCAACHGAAGEGATADMLVGGQGTLASKSPKRTIGSYWPYATTIYDYIHRAMPFDKPSSLKPDEVYALTAWLLHANGIVGADAVMDARSLPEVRMPNRDGFIAADNKPDFIAERCMSECK